MRRRRVDDRSGEDFREVLVYLRRNRPAAAATKHATEPLRWQSEDDNPDDRRLRMVTAEAGEYWLMVVEMRDSYMADKPLFLPKVSWSMYDGPGEDDVVIGSAAPTFEEAKARAELAYRVQIGMALDG